MHKSQVETPYIYGLRVVSNESDPNCIASYTSKFRERRIK